MYCNVMLQPNVFDDLQATCDEMEGHLMWFDTTQEFDALSERFWEYREDGFNDRLFTGKINTLVCILLLNV